MNRSNTKPLVTFAMIATLLSAAALVACAPGKPEGSPKARGEALYVNCSQCHGEDGHGNPAFATPAIAGLPSWYIEGQLNKFRMGIRGAHPADVDGLRMRPMSRSLMGDDEVKAVVTYVSAMSPANPAASLQGGDAERGKELFGTCVACHLADATGNPALKAPPLNRLDDWYMLAQLKKLKAGIRGANPKDTTGATMRPMAQALPDEQAMLDVIAYVQTL